MTSLLSWLRQPYPFSRSWRMVWRNALLGAGLVVFFIFVFRPFGLTVPPGREGEFLGICALYGVVTLLATVFYSGLTRLFPRFFNEADWTVGRSVLSTMGLIFFIGLGNALLSAWRFGEPLSWRFFFAWQGMTLAVGIFPTLVGALVGHMHLLRRYSETASLLSNQLAGRAAPVSAPDESVITLRGDNQGEALTVPASRLLYLAAADNYVQAFYEAPDGSVQHRLLRATLRRLEEDLADRREFMRCHRTYIVNLARVGHVSGNAQGLRLHLAGGRGAVPVSRSLSEAVQERLHAR